VPDPTSVRTDDVKVPAQTSSARRVLELLLCFTRTRHTLSSRELSELTGIALPTVYRYLTLLRELGLLIGDDRGSYHLSVRFVGLAQAAEAADALIELAHPVMRELATATGETVLLVRLIGQAAVCVHRIESSHQLRTSYEPGQPLSLEHGASARILLGSMSDSARRALFTQLATEDPERAAALEADVALARQRGWATSREEIDRGVWAVSAEVRDGDGQVVAALSVPSPLVRAPVQVRERLLGQVRAAAGRLTELLCSTQR
jgi:DNA-binding IclR family transcriptional regulator